MRTLIILILGVLAVGCKTIPVRELTGEEKKVVGEYESKYNGNILKYTFLESGIGGWYLDGKKEQEYKWAMVNGEIHAEDGDIYVYSINKDLNITYIAIIRDGKRDDSIKQANITFKKIK
jgi:hypothetical protein|tara:strand:+ start:4663 stop:5022 length:360 start_codon:yes stop_codon:yes gene_type:complete